MQKNLGSKGQNHFIINRGDWKIHGVPKKVSKINVVIASVSETISISFTRLLRLRLLADPRKDMFYVFFGQPHKK